MNNMGLYVQIPFCPVKCHFCAFGTKVYHEATARRYFSALREEIRCHGKTPVCREKAVSTVYIGGGTPTLLAEKLPELLREIHQHFQVESSAEVTIEAHPGSVTYETLRILRKEGANRISFGVQSFLDSDLAALNRGHGAEEAYEAVRQARRAGFENIGLDLIYGLPGQALSGWENNLTAAVSLSPEHLSVYGFTLEEGTYFHHLQQRGRFHEAEEALQADMYRMALDRLKKEGYVHYEVSNFARPGFASRHNLHHWTDGDYLGLGAFASSYLDGVHSNNLPSVEGYIRQIAETGSGTESSEILDGETRFKEALIFGLRKCSGIKLSEFRPEYKAFMESYVPRLIELSRDGFLDTPDGDHFQLTDHGLLFSDTVSVALS